MLNKSYADSYINSNTSNSTKKIHQNNWQDQPIIGAFVQTYYFVIGAGAVPARFIACFCI